MTGQLILDPLLPLVGLYVLAALVAGLHGGIRCHDTGHHAIGGVRRNHIPAASALGGQLLLRLRELQHQNPLRRVQ